MLRAPRAEAGGRALTVVAHEIGPFGGMESQLAELIRQLLARDIAVRAIGRRIQLEPHPNLTTYQLPGPARPFPIAYLWFFLIGSLVVARRRQGALYTMGAIVLNRADAAKVPFCHAAWARESGRVSRAADAGLAHRLSAVVSAWLSRLGERIVYRPSRCRTLVAMSRAGAAELDTLFPSLSPARTIPNGVDLERFAPDPVARREVRDALGIADDADVAVFVGGDWKRKGLQHVIVALAIRLDHQLIVVGSGDQRAMARLAAENGAASRVHFVGRSPVPERFLAAADVLAMPSVYEPWGNSALEACACGLPVVVAPAHGVSDFVEHGRSGLIVGADARSVADALEELEDPELRARFGARAREIAAGFSYAKVADAYEELLFASPVNAGSSHVPGAAASTQPSRQA